jgi:hypothetical protein
LVGSCNKSRDGPRLLEYRPQLEAGRRTTTDGSCCLFSVGRGLRLLEYTRQHPSRPPTRPTPPHPQPTPPSPHPHPHPHPPHPSTYTHHLYAHRLVDCSVTTILSHHHHHNPGTTSTTATSRGCPATASSATPPTFCSTTALCLPRRPFPGPCRACDPSPPAPCQRCDRRLLSCLCVLCVLFLCGVWVVCVC